MTVKYDCNKNLLLNVLKNVSRHLSIEEFSDCLNDLDSDIDKVNIVRNIFGNTSREVDIVARRHNILLFNLPTEIDSDGTKIWRNKEGKYHRTDGPAIEFVIGIKEWFVNGKRHRKDGPAIEYANGNKEWYLNGQRHRIDGPAYEGANGSKAWYLNGESHREDGPAIEHPDGYKEWHFDGKLHREDGPAVEDASGCKYWYLNGQLYTKNQFDKKILEINRFK